MLAYRGVHLLRTLLQRQGIHTSWAGIWNRLVSWIRGTTRMKTNAGELISIRQDTCADAGEAELLGPAHGAAAAPPVVADAAPKIPVS